MLFFQILRQSYRRFERASGMARHQIRYEILLFAYLFIDSVIFFAEFVVYFHLGFAHFAQNLRTDVFGRNFQLPAYVMLAQLIQKFIGFIRHYIVKSKSGTDEYFFDALNRTKLPQKLQVILV